MKVLCIQSSEDFCYTRKGKVRTPDEMKIRKGDTYTVVGEVEGYKGEMKYVLKEKPKNSRYKKSYFQVLPNSPDVFVKGLGEFDIEDLEHEEEPMYDFMY